MSDLTTILKKKPNWFWFSFIPVFGGLAFVYAGKKTKNKPWIWWGLGITGISLILSYSEIVVLCWLLQVGSSFYLKKEFLLKTELKKVVISDRNTANIVANYRGKIDINTASVDDLVYNLDMPIVYANSIISLRKDGFLFTRIEELTEIADIPENYVNKIEPLVTFSYDINQDFALSWRRLNTFSLTQLIDTGITPEIAQKIVTEREKNGLYSSVIDLKNRTKIPLFHYQHLI